MAKGKPPQNRHDDLMAAEVDKLLKKLPHADPSLSGERVAQPEPGAAPGRPPVSGHRREIQGGAPRVPRPRTPEEERRANLGVWGLVALGVVLGVALTQWPYNAACGLALLWYVGAVATMLVVGGWCALSSWDQRLGVAHVLSLILVFWGIVLSAEVILPRIGYSVDKATWRCRVAEPARPSATPVPVVPPLPAPAPADLEVDSTVSTEQPSQPGTDSIVAEPGDSIG
jgi:hypothetical protein